MHNFHGNEYFNIIKIVAFFLGSIMTYDITKLFYKIIIHFIQFKDSSFVSLKIREEGRRLLFLFLTNHISY